MWIRFICTYKTSLKPAMVWLSLAQHPSDLFCFLLGLLWALLHQAHLHNPGHSLYFKVSQSATVIPSATLIVLCRIEWHIYRFWGWGCGHLWGPISTTSIVLSKPLCLLWWFFWGDVLRANFPPQMWTPGRLKLCLVLIWILYDLICRPGLQVPL